MRGRFGERGELEVEVLGGDGVPEVLIGLAWLQTRRLVVDFSANFLALGEEHQLS
ncbi:MAG: hypothetical protein ACRDEA_19300 [Microcystaceae cyanobacterium]